jgi:hypothetical protein
LPPEIGLRGKYHAVILRAIGAYRALYRADPCIGALLAVRAPDAVIQGVEAHVKMLGEACVEAFRALPNLGEEEDWSFSGVPFLYHSGLSCYHLHRLVCEYVQQQGRVKRPRPALAEDTSLYELCAGPVPGSEAALDEEFADYVEFLKYEGS